MAGNFWESSHCAQWVLDKVDVAKERAPDLQVLTEEEYQKVFIFFSSFIQVSFTFVMYRYISIQFGAAKSINI